MSGTHGFVVVELHQPVKVTHVRLTHLDKKITWNFGSAPKRFRVLLSADNQGWKQGGEFIYEKNLKSNVQIFPLEVTAFPRNFETVSKLLFRMLGIYFPS